MANGSRSAGRWDALWYGGSAALALAVALWDGVPLARRWGTIAAVAYVAGAVSSLAFARTTTRRTTITIVVFTGAALLPLGLEVGWRAEHGLGTHAKSETVVTEESARALARGVDPYAADLSDGPLARFPAGVDTHVPYLPGNLVLGAGRALGLDGVLGDARLAFTAVFLTTTIAALRLSRAPSGEQLRALIAVVVSPLGTRYVAGGGNDLPVIGTMLLALVLLDRRRRAGAGLAAGLAATVKLTAWPLLPFLVIAARRPDGRHARVRTAAIAGSLVVAALLPFLLWDAPAMIEDVVLYPLGLTPGGTPAAGPTIGSALAGWFPEARGAIAAGAGVAVGLLTLLFMTRRAPRSARGAARATAAILATATALATAGRPGYLVYAIDLWLWSGWILGGSRDDTDRTTAARR